MLSLPMSVKVFWCLAPIDMRKSFDSLAAIVAEHLKHDPLSGHLFIFTSKRRDRVKLLAYERGGFAIWYKRLEEGTFSVPQTTGDGQSVELSADELGLILSGIDLAGATRRKRYERKTA